MWKHLWKYIQWFTSKPAEAHKKHCKVKMWNHLSPLSISFIASIHHWKRVCRSLTHSLTL